MSRWPWLLCTAAMASLLSGCKTPPPNPPDLLPQARPTVASGDVPTYRELVSRYNARLVGVELVSARTDVVAVWQTESGKLRRESGGGRLIVRRPLDTVVTVEKLGRTVMWAGSNDRQYWLFSDLHADGELVYGQFGGRGVAALPLPVSPALIPVLLGLTPLPADGLNADQPVEVLRGFGLIEPTGLAVRMLLDLEIGSPVRVDLLDAAGNSAVVCRLDGRQDVPRPSRDDLFLEGGGQLVEPGIAGGAGVLIPADDLPDTPLVMPESVTIYPVGQESRLELELRRVALEDSNVKQRLFDLDTLQRSLKPERVVDLDAP